MLVGIYGYGEIGSAVATLVRAGGHRVEIHDPAKGLSVDFTSKYFDVIHICVPAYAVEGCLGGITATSLVLIHSTVPPGTCAKVEASCFRRYIFHAPVRGVHPHLARSMQLCLMPIGGATKEEPEEYKAARDYLISIGISSEYWGRWETTELAKVMCTTRLGLDVLFMRHVAELCVAHDADFEKVYTEWTEAYNRGYQLLEQVVGHGFARYTRSVLKLVEGPIGGHCVTSNARLMEQESWVARKIVQDGNTHWTVPDKVPNKGE